MSDDPVSYNEGVLEERERIRAAFKHRCGLNRLSTWGKHPYKCGLNRGHIGDCSAFPGTISITRERLEEILDG